jgi:cytoskeleton protein RodZ
MAGTATATGTESTGAVANPGATATGREPVVTPLAGGSRNVALVAAGNDELRVTFKGNSWIEVDDGSMVRLYNDMLGAGDTLTIRGAAPFHVLLGDASQVQVALNDTVVDISGDIRTDSSARVVLGTPAATASTAGEQPATRPAPALEAPALEAPAQGVPQ